MSIYFNNENLDDQNNDNNNKNKNANANVNRNEQRDMNNQNREVNNQNAQKEGARKNPMEGPNEYEAQENKLNQQLGGDNEDSKLTYIYKQNIELDMSARKRKTTMKKEDKVEMERMRRWHVKINNIYITPLLKMMDPFLQFTIGGNFSVNVYKNKNGETYKLPGGQRGYTDKTEVLENIDTPQDDGTGGRAPFKKQIDIEMRMSYSMITKQKIMVELWDHNFVWMNEIYSYKTLDLIDIVNGNSNISETFYKKDKKIKKGAPFAIIDFNCFFQEIWDFNLYFLNWKSSNLLSPEKRIAAKNLGKNVKLPSSKVQIEFLDPTGDSMSRVITSVEVKEQCNPIWTTFDNRILYRGTQDELENHDVRISVYDTSSIITRLLTTKVVGLKGLLDYERLKTEMVVRDKSEGTNYTINVEGLVTIDNKPRYKQIGTNVVLLSSKKYLVIKILRVENIRPAETRGIVDSFISVEWCGMSQRTRTVKENNNPSFNECLYFQVPLQDEWLNDISKYLIKINEELATKNEVAFNLMIEGDDNTYDNFGISYFYLSDIKGSNKLQEKYYAEDLKKEKCYLSEKYTGKVKLVSAFSQSNNTFLHFEAWFLENFPPEIDFGEKKKLKERLDKIPMELTKFFPLGQDPYFSKAFANKISEAFRKYTNYSHKERMFSNTNPQDQYTNKHLLPYFLCPITIPEKKYSIKDIRTNPYFFDCNINSLEEAAHYVRCFPYPQESKNDIWSSPDFMLKLRKGNLAEHAIMMACLMMGLKNLNRKAINADDYLDPNNDQLIEDSKDEEGDTEEGNGTTGGNKIETQNPENSQNKEEEASEKSETKPGEFPYENRIFVCQGKLKESKEQCFWVMSFSENFKDIKFWDPKLSKEYELKGRVKDSAKLQKFLNNEFASYDAVKKNIVEKKTDKKRKKKQYKPKKEHENKNADLLSDLNYESDDDFNAIDINESGYDQIIDDNIGKQQKDNQNEGGFNFLEDDKDAKELSDITSKNFLPEDTFTDEMGRVVPEVIGIPYETIDLIFNQNNIYANCAYHSPESIYYNIYDKSRWHPYFILEEDKLWRGRFEPFYSMCNFGPVYSPNLIKKMTEALIKEMRVGIAAARSGKNLPTKFKPKNEKINSQLGKYLEYLENRAINRMSEKEFEEKIENWKVVIKKYMPKFYRMEAQSIYFNFFETEIIRREITEDLEEFWYSKIKNVMFATSARVFGYPNQIVSVRIMLAKIYRIPKEDITDKEELKEYEEMLKEDPNKLVEQQSDSDDEEEQEIVKKVKEKVKKRQKLYDPEQEKLKNADKTNKNSNDDEYGDEDNNNINTNNNEGTKTKILDEPLVVENK